MAGKNLKLSHKEGECKRSSSQLSDSFFRKNSQTKNNEILKHKRAHSVAEEFGNSVEYSVLFYENLKAAFYGFFH